MLILTTILSLTLTQVWCIVTTLENTVTLTCSSPSPWFFCVWEGPPGNRACGLKNSDEALCGEDRRLQISGECNDLTIGWRKLNLLQCNTSATIKASKGQW